MFSVIIPLYNKAHTIERTLRSVFAQTYQKFEVIVINDGSTDGSEEIVEKIENQRIRLISQENLGVSAARNRGVQESKHEWIAFLDGDDEWMPNYLESVSTVVKTLEDVELILTGRYGQDYISNKRIDVTPKQYYNKLEEIDFFQNPHVFAHISATTVKRETLVNSFDNWGKFIEGQKSNEDFTFLFRAALHVKVGYYGLPLAIYNGNVSNQATSTISPKKKLSDSIQFHNTVLDEWVSTSFDNKSFRVFMRYEMRHIILQYIKKNDYFSLVYFVENVLAKRTYIMGGLECGFYTKKSLKSIATLFIMLTKLRWRLRGFPVVRV